MTMRRHSIKKIILGYILGLATVFGVAYASGQPQPSVGLYWYANSDPTVAPGVSAPMYQLMIRTDIQAVYWKSGGGNTAWTRITGTGTGAGTVTSITCTANEGLLCTPNPITGAGTIGIAQLVTIQNEQINTETLAELDNYDPWHAGPHTTRVEVDPTQPNLLISGIVAGNDGDLLWLWNGGNGGTNPNTITLPSQSASSTGLNRFWIANGKLVNIPNNDGVLLIYDGAFGWTCFQCATSILRAQEISFDPAAVPVALTAGTQYNNYNPFTTSVGTTSYVRQDVTGPGVADVTGIIAAGAPNSDGRVLVIENISTSGGVIEIDNANGGSTGPNQILTQSGKSIFLAFQQSVTLMYDTTEDAYRVQSATGQSNGTLTESTLPANPTQNYSPTGLANSNIINITGDTGFTLCGLDSSAAWDGKTLTFTNFSGGTLLFDDECAGSSVGNQFFTQAALERTIGNYGAITFKFILGKGWIETAESSFFSPDQTIATLNSTTINTATIVATTFESGSSGPTWTSGASAPTGACTTGSTYSVTTSSANPANYACANSAWINITTGAVERNAVYFGPGTDGTITFDGTSTVLGIVPSASTYTLTRDIIPSNMTVNSGVTIATANYMISVSNTLNNNGTISNNGIAGSHGTGGGTTPAGRFPININGGQGGGTGGGGSKAPLGFLASAAAAAGGTAGNPGINGTNGAGNGGGGGGATSGAGSTGGAQTVGTLVPSFDDYLRGAHTSDGVSMSFGTGGGAGGNGSSLNGYGGAGGSIVLITAATIKSTGATGAIQARGGAGGTAVASDNAGGGGGGGGGVVVLVYNTGANTQTTDENGGAGGLGSTGDATGKGGNGGNGVAYLLNLSGDGT